MRLTRPLTAILTGLHLCVRDPEIRRHAVRPWLIGAASYVVFGLGAVYGHDVVLGWLVGAPTGWLATVWFYVAWLLVALLLFVATFILTAAVVMVASGPAQTAIATILLMRSGVVPPGEAGILGEAARSAGVELRKLLWVVPVTLCALTIGLVPVLAPVALVVGAWLLAFQFVDVVLDLFRLPIRARLRFGRRHGLVLTVFGATLTVLFAVPFLGILLTPAAAAGATKLVLAGTMLDEIRTAAPVAESSAARRPAPDRHDEGTAG